MNKAQIKAELRRAANGPDPWLNVGWDALQTAYMFEGRLCTRKYKHVSWFFLLVAEAL